MSLTTLFISAALLAAPGTPASEAAPLPRGLQSTFERVVQAYYAGDSAAVWKVLAPMVARWSETQVAALDEALAAREIPGVGELLVSVRMGLVQQNLAHALPEPQIRERMLVLEALRDRIHEIVQEQREHRLVTGLAAAPDSLVEFEHTLWEIHVLRNKLLTAFRATQYAQALASGVTERVRERLTDEERTLLAAAGDPLADVEAASGALDELDAELRLKRLDHGLAVLERPGLTEERFLAAWSTQHDAEVLSAFLKDSAEGGASRRFTREALARPGLAEEIAAKAERARQLAGDLAEKTRLLFEGLHWWRRGRFGSGPELAGLAKSEAAAETPGGLVWLYMPAEPPLPDPARDEMQPADDNPVITTSQTSDSSGTIEYETPSARRRVTQPPVERRHHYTWAWEDRRIVTTMSSGASERTLSESYVTKPISTFW